MRFFLLIFFLVGFGCLAGGFYGYDHVRDFLKSSRQAEGKVIELARHQSTSMDHADGIYFYPVIQFTTSENKKIEFVASSGSNPAEYEVGDRVPVLYDPLRPHQAKINSFLDVWLFPVIFFFLGSVFLLLAIVLYFVVYRPEQIRLTAVTRTGIHKDKPNDLEE